MVGCCSAFFGVESGVAFENWKGSEAASFDSSGLGCSLAFALGFGKSLCNLASAERYSEESLVSWDFFFFFK